MKEDNFDDQSNQFLADQAKSLDISDVLVTTLILLLRILPYLMNTSGCMSG